MIFFKASELVIGLTIGFESNRNDQSGDACANDGDVEWLRLLVHFGRSVRCTGELGTSLEDGGV